MRGKVKTADTLKWLPRITPAYAGKRLSLLFFLFQLRDHPRLCGEKQVFLVFLCLVLGSPPPMRGKENVKNVLSKHMGITPAYAGKSSHTRRCPSIDWDHPRLCGEKIRFFAYIVNSEGSPPPMRGKANIGDDIGDDFRITPAYAGKSSDYKAGKCLIWDHPRLCGEKLKNGRETLVLQGSPPPMRGKALNSWDKSDSHGITPAYAGKRFKKKPTGKESRDHPRLCGEKTKKILKQRYFFHQPASFSFSLQYT